ncbi:MAG: SUMF1/EgtB/PvdO family nonheme iron enzyme, partial [Candidatus Contendobacter sp.]|nr:SUMF1/EgtB/PvdO family nonheme iron enzyme [Candidatus Contendobacter sp.]
EETAVLAAAMADRPDAFVADLMAANLALAGRCAAQPDVQVSESVKDRIRQALIERTRDPAADLRARIAAGLALGELGDPRLQRCQGPHGDYLLPPLVSIPGGAYSIGSDEGLYDEEAPIHAVNLQPFQLGQFPVTNAEYALFVKAGGYEDERWWETDAARAWQRGESTAEGARQKWREDRQTLQARFDAIRDWQRQGRITSQQTDLWEKVARMDDDEFEAFLQERYPAGRQTQPAFWNDEAFNNPAQPVVGIRWYEARAYCAWLSAQTGQPFRLPTEAEWEAAARGRTGRRYAYGDAFDASFCNAFETHVRRTTPVGVFPGGETPDGLIDMTGNTWDWTGSLYQPYPYDATDGREDPAGDARRVVRGGGWLSSEILARVTYRLDVLPTGRSNGRGFRLACTSPI